MPITFNATHVGICIYMSLDIAFLLKLVLNLLIVLKSGGSYFIHVRRRGEQTGQVGVRDDRATQTARAYRP